MKLRSAKGDCGLGVNFNMNPPPQYLKPASKSFTLLMLAFSQGSLTYDCQFSVFEPLTIFLNTLDKLIIIFPLIRREKLDHQIHVPFFPDFREQQFTLF